MQKVAFAQMEGINFKYNKRRMLKKIIVDIFTMEKKQLHSLQYVFCSDDFLFDMNIKYLDHHTYTDIITFDLSEKNNITKGEIYISIDRIKENAKEHKVSFEFELERVIFHGALHLCGYKDKTKPQKNAMTARENYYLNKFYVTRGT